ncbi:MAG: Acyltransferase family protein [Candidatus Tokpelaia hoelldobleri]|uniref:Acyltransferase family protein n=1 Tax=Candidatus Tokpelaia hoelldobleri TaxID=1902579 RepID=A0A1U9JUW5_9HYPH|nr:MAG: Acyltransferase family protein [Candidatus Tokpelaia hoelldoblerii]
MPASTKNIRLEIQGLRAIAVIAVILFHMDKNWLPGGFVGVDIFFVISGFLITSIILKGKDNHNFSWVSFYLGRIRRIVPAYLVLLAFVTFVAFILCIPSDYTTFLASLKQALIFNSAHYFGKFGGYFAQASYELPLQHTWTLAIEMQFYLLLPFLLIFLPKQINRLLIPALIIFLLVRTELFLSRPDYNHQKLYFALVTRVPEFLLGTLLVLYRTGDNWTGKFRKIASLAGISLIIFSVIYLNEESRFPGIMAMLPCLGAALLIASHGGICAPLLNNKPMVGIGNLSYSLYLWHWPILAFARYIRMNYSLPLIWLVVLAGFILLCAWLSYKFIETPLRKSSNKKLAIFFLSFFIIFTFLLSFTQKLQKNFLEQSVKTEFYAKSGDCHRTQGQCLRGNVNATKPPLLIIGDSFAGQLNRFFDVVAEDENFSFRILSSSDCAILIPDKPKVVEDRKLCQEQTAYAQAFIKEADTIIIARNWTILTNRDPERLDPTIEAIKELAQTGKKIILFAQIPIYAGIGERSQRFQQLGIISLSINAEAPASFINGKPGWIDANEVIKHRFATTPNVIFVDYTDLPLFKKPFYYKGQLIYYNESHLNRAGSTIWGQQAKERFLTFLKSLGY